MNVKSQVHKLSNIIIRMIILSPLLGRWAEHHLKWAIAVLDEMSEKLSYFIFAVRFSPSSSFYAPHESHEQQQEDEMTESTHAEFKATLRRRTKWKWGFSSALPYTFWSHNNICWLHCKREREKDEWKSLSKPHKVMLTNVHGFPRQTETKSIKHKIHGKWQLNNTKWNLNSSSQFTATHSSLEQRSATSTNHQQLQK